MKNSHRTNLRFSDKARESSSWKFGQTLKKIGRTSSNLTLIKEVDRTTATAEMKRNDLKNIAIGGYSGGNPEGDPEGNPDGGDPLDRRWTAIGTSDETSFAALICTRIQALKPLNALRSFPTREPSAAFRNTRLF